MPCSKFRIRVKVFHNVYTVFLNDLENCNEIQKMWVNVSKCNWFKRAHVKQNQLRSEQFYGQAVD